MLERIVLAYKKHKRPTLRDVVDSEANIEEAKARVREIIDRRKTKSNEREKDE